MEIEPIVLSTSLTPGVLFSLAAVLFVGGLYFQRLYAKAVRRV